MTNDDLKQIDKLLEKKFKDQDKKIEAVLENKLASNKEEVIEEMADFMNENLFPYFDKLAHKTDIERIEGRLDSLAVTVGAHEIRINDIERVPVIAHQLKVNKKK